MDNDAVHQALFGYAKGHRMLVASRPIPIEQARMLRAATDTAVERRDSQYLTVRPLPELGVQAFVRTWPAEEWLRRGSVWSHVLLVDFVTLANAVSLDPIVALFRRPRLDPGQAEPDTEPYRSALSVPAIVAPDTEALCDPVIDNALAGRVLDSVYGTLDRVVVRVEDAAAAESTLLAIHEQQWPRLRRHFAFRTRLRASDGPMAFDLEVVERIRAGRSDDPSDLHHWVAPLLVDLGVAGGTELRYFLRAFGPESIRGRHDLPALVTVYTHLVNDPPPMAASALSQTFPRPSEMKVLKRALLGRDDAPGWKPPPHWPANDPGRLELLFAADPSAVDYEDLQVGPRLAVAINTAPVQTATALHRLDLEQLPPRHVQTIVAAIVDGATDESAADLAGQQPDLGVLLVAQRPALLGRVAIWDTLDPGLLIEVFDRAPRDERDAALCSLLHAGAADPLTSLCAATPSTWWELLFASARPGTEPASIAAHGRVLRRVLLRVGAAAIGGPDRAPRSEEELLAVLVGADLSAGLWRHAPAVEWLRLWRLAAKTGALPPPFHDRLATVTLLAANASGSRQLRIDAWLATFPSLHHTLGTAGFDDEAWTALSTALPAAPEWDRCLRLRQGVVGEIRRDHWSAADTALLLDASGEYRDEIVSELHADADRKKGKHWLRALIEALLPR